MEQMICPRKSNHKYPSVDDANMKVQTRTMDKGGTWEIWVCPSCGFEKAVYVAKEEAKARG